jgi:hypothetical protein
MFGCHSLAGIACVGWLVTAIEALSVLTGAVEAICAGLPLN